MTERTVSTETNQKGFNMLVPYVGITDFMNFQQVKEMLRIFKAHLPKGSRRKLHVGVMMMYKTMNGIDSRWRDSVPRNDEVAAIFACSETYNCLHYADYDRDTKLPDSLYKAIAYGGPGMHALQLDMIWPDPDDIALAVRESGRNIEIILQVGRKAFKEIRDRPQNLVARLRDYEGVIHRVLLDKSGGEGREMDAVGLVPFAAAIQKNFPRLGLVAAGGLGPDTMDLVKPLHRERPDISIDMQGKLKPHGNRFEPTDWKLAGNALIKALQLLG